MLDWHLPEVEALYEGPVYTLCQESWNEVLPYPILDIL